MSVGGDWGGGPSVQVPLTDLHNVKEGYPWDIFGTYSKHPLPNVAVDRWPAPPTTPNQPFKSEAGHVMFAHGAYARQSGMYGEFKVR